MGHVIEAIVRERPLDGGAGLIELRVAVVGNVDSGKSTLVGAFFGVQSSCVALHAVAQRETSYRAALHAVEREAASLASTTAAAVARGHCFRHKHEVDNGAAWRIFFRHKHEVTTAGRLAVERLVPMVV